MENNVDSILLRVEECLEDSSNGKHNPFLENFVRQYATDSVTWAIGCYLMGAEHAIEKQLFGTICIRSWIEAINVKSLEFSIAELADTLVGKINDPNYFDVTNQCLMATPVITKLCESLVILVFRTAQCWHHPLRDIITQFVKRFNDKISELPSVNEMNNFHLLALVDSAHIKQSLLLFLFVLTEQCSSTDSSHSLSYLIKQRIHSDELLVKKILQWFADDSQSETVRCLAIRTCTAWITTFATESSATDYLDLIEPVYLAMHCSENLYTVGVNCLTTLFEADGSGLNSGNVTVYLLDYHISHLTKFEQFMQRLLVRHDSALKANVNWDEFCDRELLTKTVLLLSVLCDKQVDQLIRKLESIKEADSDVHRLFNMFLLTLASAGQYSFDENLSDLGLQIWMNMHEYSIGLTNNCTSLPLANIHLKFINYSYDKIQYPSDLSKFANNWTKDQRDQWYRFRQELSGAMHSAFDYLNLNHWFVDLRNKLIAVLMNYSESNANVDWQHLEPMIFTLSAISESVLHGSASHIMEFRQLIPQLLCKIVQLVQNNWSNICFSLEQQIFCIALLIFIRKYLPLLNCANCDSHDSRLSTFWGLCQFALDCLINTMGISNHMASQTSMPNNAAELIQKIVQDYVDLPRELVEYILSRLVQFYAQQTNKRIDVHTDTCLFYSVGHLLARLISVGNPALYTLNDEIVYPRLVIMELLCNANVSDIKQEGQLTAFSTQFGISMSVNRFDLLNVLLKSFVQLFRGYVQSLDMCERRSDHSPLLEWFIKIFDSLKQILIVHSVNIPIKLYQQLDQLNQMAVRLASMLDRPICVHLINLIMEFNSIILDSPPKLNDQLLQLFYHLIEETHTVKDHIKQVDTYMPHLLSIVLARINCVLMEQAKLAMLTEHVVSPGTINATHPLSPVLMAMNCQLVTDDIQAFSQFFISLFGGKSQGAVVKENFKTYKFLDTLLPQGKTELVNILRLAASVAFAGIALPEWTTVENCLRLARILLSDVANRNEIFHINFLMEIHICMLLVLTKGGLPRRLTVKFAELYSALSDLHPTRNFILLSLIMDCHNGATAEQSNHIIRELRPNNLKALSTLIKSSIDKISLIEREVFVSTMNRPSNNLDRIRQQIYKISSRFELKNHE